MSEGMTAAGLIRSAMRLYAASHAGVYPTLNNATGAQLSVISIGSSELEGKYFSATDYRVTSDATSYTVRATLPGSSGYWYEIDQDGEETKGWE
jgi:hypothetical protein